MDDRPGWERDLDAMVRPAFVVDPPAEVQQAILAAVLQAAPQPARPVGYVTSPMPVAVGSGRTVPLAAYVLLAAVFMAYAAALSWFQGLFGGTGWLTTLLTQLLAVAELVVGRPPVGEPLALAWLLLQKVPWLALLPLGWLLWEQDRAAARVA